MRGRFVWLDWTLLRHTPEFGRATASESVSDIGDEMLAQIAAKRD